MPRRCARDLFRRRIVRREQTSACLGDGGIADAPVVEQLGDAEVEQLHLAFVGDEDVGGLQIAMDDQPCVRVRDGARHQQEQAQPGVNRQLLRS